MTIKSLPIVYLTASTELERDMLNELLSPHSWATGEFGMMLTDGAFVECVESLSDDIGNPVKILLKETAMIVHNTGAGDICLNYLVAS